MTISNELPDELLKGYERPEDLLGDAGLMKELKIKLMERMLGAELTAHLGYEAGKDAPPGQPNRRNGTAGKRLKGQDGEMPISVPGSLEPEPIRKDQTRIDGIDDKIIGLYAHGLTIRDIRVHLEELYGLKVSAGLISRVTDTVLDEVRDWQSRAPERMYPIVIFDALRVKIRDQDSRMVKNKVVFVALGVSRDGVRESLDLWIADNESAKFWLSVMTELKNRGVADILIAVVDGLKSFWRRSRRPSLQDLHRSPGAPFPELLRLVRTASPWRATCAGFTGLLQPARPPPGWMHSRKNGPANTPPSPRPGGGLGRK